MMSLYSLKLPSYYRVLGRDANGLLRILDLKRGFELFVHETAYVDEGAIIGEGSFIWHYSHVMSGAKLGNKVKVGQNVFIASDVQIGNNVKIQNNVSIYTGVIIEDDVFIGPSAVFTNVKTPRAIIPRNTPEHFLKTLIRRGATIGANATIICGVEIGEWAFVGAGAVVTRDVKPHSLVYGTPAVHRGWVCKCGVRLQEEGEGKLSCPECGRRYLLVEDRLKEMK